jgi:Phasin protein
MSVIERGQSFVKEINELNVNAVSKYFEIQREALEQFVGANRQRFAALRDVKGLEDLVTAQREYYSAVQKNVADSIKKQAELVRDNVTTTGKLVRELFNREEEAGSPTPQA